MTAEINSVVKTGCYAKMETYSLSDDFEGILNEALSDWNEWEILEISYKVYIDNYGFDVNDVQRYSDSTKTFLEKIIHDEDIEKLDLFDSLAYSSNGDLLMKEGVDLGTILRNLTFLHIGDYDFDIHEIIDYSESTKTFLEKTMELDCEDVEDIMGLFYEFSKSHKRDILKKEGIDLDSILRDFQIENSNKKKTIEQLMTLEATAISQSTL